MTVKNKTAAQFEYDDDVYKEIGLLKESQAKTSTILESVVTKLQSQDVKFESLFRAINDLKESTAPNVPAMLKIGATYAALIFAGLAYYSNLIITPIAEKVNLVERNGHVETQINQAVLKERLKWIERMSDETRRPTP